METALVSIFIGAMFGGGIGFLIYAIFKKS